MDMKIERLKFDSQTVFLMYIEIDKIPDAKVKKHLEKVLADVKKEFPNNRIMAFPMRDGKPLVALTTIALK